MKELKRYKTKFIKKIVKTLRETSKPISLYSNSHIFPLNFEFKESKLKEKNIIGIYKNGEIDIKTYKIKLNFYDKFLIRKEVNKFLNRANKLFLYNLLKEVLDE